MCSAETGEDTGKGTESGVFKERVSTYENLSKKAGLPTLRNRRLQDLMV